MWVNQFAMMRDSHPEGTSFCRTNPKFMQAQLGPTKATIYLQRGYRQYGQPHECTLDAVVHIDEDEAAESYVGFKEKLCHTTCEYNISIRPSKNFFDDNNDVLFNCSCLKS